MLVGRGTHNDGFALGLQMAGQLVEIRPDFNAAFMQTRCGGGDQNIVAGAQGGLAQAVVTFLPLQG